MGSFRGNLYEVLRRPIITEKAAGVGTTHNAVVFEVHPEATKYDIKSAVEKIFDVKVTAVRTVNSMGKLKRGKKSIGRQRASKKAYVSLEKGQTIDIVEGL
jgi:large subunit ribosomal protein L23